ncbi:retrovirus-related pol polyprotein from transposon TNT 1-94 [Tanacetum coccineum]|uniref:Retrovirus-related pol polyprotein from transposon TNT 1-94 n=1 Tax=Tanacetum coccineum TaxID=301880 RepID=A0ABQ5BZM9_9ASTR
MKSYGDQINEEAVVSKVLRSLSSKFNHVVAAIEEAHDLSSYSFDELMSSLLAHEGTPHKNKPRRKHSKLKVEAEEEVNLMKDKIGTPFNGEIATSMATKMLIAGANRKVVPYTINTARSMDIEMLIVGANRKASNTVPILAKLQRRDYLRPILVNASNKENNVWYIDSGCSNHMCGARSMFKELDESQRKEVTLGNDWKMKVEGKVILQLKPHNVIGHSILFDDSCVIKDKKSGKIVANMTQNRIFPFDISTVESFDLVAGASVKNIWHLRYGHLSINGLQFLEHKGMVIGLPKIDTIDFCEDCVYGNQSRPSFPIRYSM